MTESNRCVLCLDVGYVAMGWAIVQPAQNLVRNAGCIVSKPEKRKRKVRQMDLDAERSAELFANLRSIIAHKDAAYQIVGIIAEMPTGGSKSSRAAACMARSSTIVVLAASVYNLPLEIILPMDAKRAATGDRCASKEAVQYAICAQSWGEKLRDAWPRWSKATKESVADALAAYLAAANGTLVRSLMI